MWLILPDPTAATRCSAMSRKVRHAGPTMSRTLPRRSSVLNGAFDRGGDVGDGHHVDRVVAAARDERLASVPQVGADHLDPGLDERDRPDDRPIQATVHEGQFGCVLHLVQPHRMDGCRTVDGDQDEVVDGRVHRGRDQVAVPVAVDRRGADPSGPDEAVNRRDHCCATRYGFRNRGRRPHVAHHDVKPGGPEVGGLVFVAGEDAHGMTLRGERPHQRCAESAGATGDEDHRRAAGGGPSTACPTAPSAPSRDSSTGSR